MLGCNPSRYHVASPLDVAGTQIRSVVAAFNGSAQLLLRLTEGQATPYVRLRNPTCE
jgi:hypothetical protein